MNCVLLGLFLPLIFHACTKLYSGQPDYRHTTRLRLIKTSIMIGSVWIWIWLINESYLFAILLTLVLMPVSAQCVMLRLHKDSKLILVPAVFSDTGHLHLASVNAPMCKETYQELKEIVRLLPETQLDKLVLTSPLLGKNGQFRNTWYLEKLLDGYPVTITQRILPSWTAPIQTVSMAWHKWIRRHSRMRTADLTQRYQLIITPIPVNSLVTG